MIFNSILFQAQKEDLDRRVLQLQTQLDAKQAVQLEIEQLRGNLNVVKHMVGDDGDLEVLRKVEDIHKSLREKEGEYEDLQALNQALIIKERKSNDELQEARKELVTVSLPAKLSIYLCHIIKSEVMHVCLVDL